MQGPICCKSYNINGDPELLIFLLVHKNIYNIFPLCTRLLTSVLAELWFFKSSDRGCRTKGPLPNLGRLTVFINKVNSNRFPNLFDNCMYTFVSTFKYYSSNKHYAIPRWPSGMTFSIGSAYGERHFAFTFSVTPEEVLGETIKTVRKVENSRFNVAVVDKFCK